MLKKLYMSLKISNLLVAKLLSYKVTVMHNFVTKFGKFLRLQTICRKSSKREGKCHSLRCCPHLLRFGGGGALHHSGGT